METSSSRKSFEKIHEDYAFFLEHSTEKDACREAMLEVVRSVAARQAEVSWLDFGCGGGEFLSELVAEAAIPPASLRLSLVDVDASYLVMAKQRVAEFSTSRVKTAQTLAELKGGKFDLITSNHALYYVRNMEATLRELFALLRSEGRAALLLGGEKNQLCRLWLEAWKGRALPYYLAKDVESALVRWGKSYEERLVQSVLDFPDTRENRMKILRFLFADKLEVLDVEALVESMNPWQREGRMVMPNTDVLFVCAP